MFALPAMSLVIKASAGQRPSALMKLLPFRHSPSCIRRKFGEQTSHSNQVYCRTFSHKNTFVGFYFVIKDDEEEGAMRKTTGRGN